MTAAVGNPASRGMLATMKPLGAQAFLNPGTFTVTVPQGTKYVRMELRAGGGASGAQASNLGASGGGQGAIVRAVVRCTDSFSVTVGAGGLGTSDKGGDGGYTSALGKSAAGGSGGLALTLTDHASGGVGPDGPEPTFGFGNFSGLSGNAANPGGPNPNGLFGAITSKGVGGAGMVPSPTQRNGNPGVGGYAYFEFFG